MGSPSQIIDESPVADAETDAPAGVEQSAIDAAVDAAVAKFAAEHGIDPPAATAVQQSALQALQQLEHTSFAKKLEALAEKGIQEAELVSETPVVRTLAAIVAELIPKA